MYKKNHITTGTKDAPADRRSMQGNGAAKKKVLASITQSRANRRTMASRRMRAARLPASGAMAVSTGQHLSLTPLKHKYEMRRGTPS